MNACLTTNFVVDFLQGQCDFIPKSAVLRFPSSPLGDLGATYDDHLMLIRRYVVDFLLVVIELFSPRRY